MRARFPGVCGACGMSFPEGTPLERGKRGWVHAPTCPASVDEAQKAADALAKEKDRGKTRRSAVESRDGAEWFSLPYPFDTDFIEAVKNLPRRRFDGDTKTWFAPASDIALVVKALARVDATYASRILDHDQFKTAREAADRVSGRVEASRKAEASLAVPAPVGLAYRPYQVAGIEYALDRPATLIGDEPGLGKTIQVIGLINSQPDVHHVLVVCPASLRLNWRHELERWLTRSFTISVVDGKKGWPKALDADHVVIINYDVLAKHPVRETTWDLLVTDEAHYLKNPKTARCREVFGYWDKESKTNVPGISAVRRVFLTGTPIPNRPVELWPLLQSLDPSGLGRNWRRYVERYCAAYEGKYGWDVSGASHLDELQRLMRGTFMVRRLKSQVLTELPPKTRQVVVLPANGAANAVKAEQAAIAKAEAEQVRLETAAALAAARDDDRAYEAAVEALRVFQTALFSELARLRHETALQTVPYVVEAVRNAGHKVVVFAWHQDVIELLRSELESGDDPLRCVVLTGATSMHARDEAVQAFQNNPAVQVFLGNIQAAGTGLTLTAASHVLFAELDWVPGNVTQAEDRCHRISQTEMVLVQHLVLQGSIAARMAQIIVEKQAVIDAALDTKHTVEGPDALVAALQNGNFPEASGFTVEAFDEIKERNDRAEARAEKAAARGVARAMQRERIREIAQTLSSEQINAIHECLRGLAVVCDGAHAKDGAGFNATDVAVGHTLSRQGSLSPTEAAMGREVVIKYKGQLEARALPYDIAVGGIA